MSSVSRGRRDGRWFNCSHQVSTFLRLSYCENVCIDVARLQNMVGDALMYVEAPSFDNVSGVMFDDLDAKNTSVDAMSMKMDKGCEDTAMRK